MAMNDICNPDVITLERNSTISQAAKLMRQHHIGAVVVVEMKNGRRAPIGVVTDRDIVVELVATELDPDVITVGDIMAHTLVSINEKSGLFEAIRLMADKGVRRLPVTDEKGGLAGIVALDDMLLLLTKELSALSKLVEREQKSEAKKRH